MRCGVCLKYLAFVAGGVMACGGASCGGKDVTSICPSLPRFGDSAVGDSSNAGAAGDDAQAALARAMDAGCVTAPMSSANGGGDGGMGRASNNGHDAGAGGSSAGAAGQD